MYIVGINSSGDPAAVLFLFSHSSPPLLFAEKSRRPWLNSSSALFALLLSTSFTRGEVAASVAQQRLSFYRLALVPLLYQQRGGDTGASAAAV